MLLQYMACRSPFIVILVLSCCCWHGCLASNHLRRGAIGTEEDHDQGSRSLLTQIVIIPESDPNAFSAFGVATKEGHMAKDREAAIAAQENAREGGDTSTGTRPGTSTSTASGSGSMYPPGTAVVHEKPNDSQHHHQNQNPIKEPAAGAQQQGQQQGQEHEQAMVQGQGQTTTTEEEDKDNQDNNETEEEEEEIKDAEGPSLVEEHLLVPHQQDQQQQQQQEPTEAIHVQAEEAPTDETTTEAPPPRQEQQEHYIFHTTTTTQAASTNYNGQPLGPFQLRLHWTPRSCWHGDCQTRQHWCMQCEGFQCNWGDIVWVEECRPDRPPQQLFYWIPIPLLYLGGSDVNVVDVERRRRNGNDNNDTPDADNDSQQQQRQSQSQQQASSRVWGQLQMRSTEWWPTGFDDGSFYQANVYLCLERWATRRYYLAYCNVARQQQWFHGMNPHEPFELYSPPLLLSGSEPPVPRKDKCLKPHHHPRQFEEVIHTTCDQARAVRTHMWETIPATPLLTVNSNTGDNHNIGDDGTVTTTTVIASAQGAPRDDPSADFSPFNARQYYTLGEGRRDPRCRPDAQCGVCQGHCRSDDECAGSLECFERNKANPEETPPGCFGPGVPRMDYCYARPGN